ncbi:hypothetical protein C1645_860760 [Glomus cerebriforme]|uniref:HMG box domain-containing protein n=1 Tax=Glomus cerebriforme TaxID=658196 RepID=A0A397SB79_9GLOM|nr:hypothetical protein C1645_860760 [Glomus cerebriforme]
MFVFQYSEKPEKKKKTSNPFFLFRDNMRKDEPVNIKMTELNHKASIKWKSMSDDEKAPWRKLYEINRDTTNTETTINKDIPTSDVHYIHLGETTYFDPRYICYLCGCLLGTNRENCLDCRYTYVNCQIYDSFFRNFSNNSNNYYPSFVLKDDCYLTKSLEVNDIIEEPVVEDI